LTQIINSKLPLYFKEIDMRSTSHVVWIKQFQLPTSSLVLELNTRTVLTKVAKQRHCASFPSTGRRCRESISSALLKQRSKSACKPQQQSRCY